MNDSRSGIPAPGRGAGVTLVAALGLAACGQPEPPPPTPPQVTVATPLRRDVTFYQDFTGRTASVQRAAIRARVPGFLERMNFVPGDMVKKGQLLFVIEPEPYRAQRDQAEAALKSAEANRARAQSDLERLEEAIKTNAVSQQDVTRARAELAQAEASVLSSSAELAQARIQLQYTQVRSPVAGKVDRNTVDLGNLVGQTEATQLTTVVQMNPLWVYFDLPETIVLAMLADLRKMGVKDTSDIHDPEFQETLKFFVGTQVDEGFPHEGHLDFLSNTVNAATGTVEVRGVVPNDDLTLLPGVFVRVRVPGRLMPNSILVSERAIGTDLGGKYVMVVGAENVVEQRYIELGPREDDGFVVVTSGLEGDESYIVNGLLRARPGFPVTPKPHEDDGETRAQGQS
jgi:RND family efflux transporter MFP subunit